MPAAALRGPGVSPRPRRDPEPWRLGCPRVGAGGPPCSSGTPATPQTSKTPVQNTKGKTPLHGHTSPCEPRGPRAAPRALRQSPGLRGASPHQGPGARGEPRPRRGDGPGAPGQLTAAAAAAAAGEAAAALARGPGGAAGLQRRRGCGGRDCGGRHLGALPAPAPRAARALA